MKEISPLRDHGGKKLFIKSRIGNIRLALVPDNSFDRESFPWIYHSVPQQGRRPGSPFEFILICIRQGYFGKMR